MVIRTQDRNGLVPFDSAVIMFAPQINKFVINDGNVRLGCYNSIEVAQGILDDIEDMFLKEGTVEMIGNLGVISPKQFVFEMPEEE